MMKTFLLYLYSRLLRLFVSVNPRILYFIPHPNCYVDNYDVQNYSSDNVLSLINYLLHNRTNQYIYIIEIYNKDRIESYIEYISKINPTANVKFIIAEELRPSLVYRLKKYIYKMRSRYIFTCTYYYDFSYRKSNTTAVCLSYFTPFKNDYYTSLGKQKINKSYDYYVSTSKISSQITSISTGIDYCKFVNLGFPRNDNLLKKNISALDIIKDIVGYVPKSIIVYTPTYRDYEEDREANLLGYSDSLLGLNNYLVQESAVFIFKMHPLHKCTKEVNSLKAFLDMSTISYSISLYDILSVSDLLITDYTSAYFDFLLLNKPIIFNFYDKDRYNEARGFSYEPIEEICAGDIVTSYNDLLDAIKINLNTKQSKYIKRQKAINALFNKFHDSNSSERICNYFDI